MTERQLVKQHKNMPIVTILYFKKETNDCTNYVSQYIWQSPGWMFDRMATAMMSNDLVEKIILVNIKRFPG